MPDLSGLDIRYAPRWDDPAIGGRVAGGRFAPRFILVHHTGGTNSYDWLANGRPHPPVPGAHFLIDRDGTIHALTCRQAYHAGPGSGWGVPDDLMNCYAWGIEVESRGLSRDFTAAQRQSLGGLMARLLDDMGRGPEAILNHKDWNRGKTDTRYARDELRSWLPEEDDMPLSDRDIDRIARAVWRYQIKNYDKTMQRMLRVAYETATNVQPIIDAETDDDEDA